VLTPFRTVYFDLRARVQAHIQQGLEPELSLSSAPRGGCSSQPVSNQNISEIEVGYDSELGGTVAL
jgi:hypothetical protein